MGRAICWWWSRGGFNDSLLAEPTGSARGWFEVADTAFCTVTLSREQHTARVMGVNRQPHLKALPHLKDLP